MCLPFLTGIEFASEVSKAEDDLISPIKPATAYQLWGLQLAWALAQPITGGASGFGSN